MEVAGRHSHWRLTGPSEVQQANIMLVLQMQMVKGKKRLLNTYYAPDTFT